MADPRFTPFRERLEAFYQWRWNQECPWDASEANQLSRLLKACPKLEVATFSRWLYNYGCSEDIQPGERPRKFLPRIHDYSVAVLDRFRRDKNVRSGETFAERDATNTIAASRRILADLAGTGSHVPALAASNERTIPAPTTRRSGTLFDGINPLSLRQMGDKP